MVAVHDRDLQRYCGFISDELALMLLGLLVAASAVLRLPVILFFLSQSPHYVPCGRMTTPLICAAGVFFMFTDHDLRLRTQLSEPALTELVERVLQSEDGWAPESGAGLFHVRSAWCAAEGQPESVFRPPLIYGCSTELARCFGHPNNPPDTPVKLLAVHDAPPLRPLVCLPVHLRLTDAPLGNCPLIRTID